MPLTPGETRFVRSGATDIAYQVIGDGPVDVVVGIGWVSHVELLWELPEAVHFLERLAALGRVVLYDARGTGMSDRPVEPPRVEDLVPDLLAVLDAADVEEAVLVGWLDKAALALAVAARHPERVRALVLGEPMASTVARPGHPAGLDPETVERLAAAVEQGSWGTGALLPWIAPEVAEDPRVTAWWRRWERMSATPSRAAAMLRMLLDIDVRELVPHVAAPALLLHRTGAALVPGAAVDWLADALPHARSVALPGTSLAAFFGDSDALLDEVEDFVRGTRTGTGADRRVTTLLLTDLVASTERAAELGDRRWHELLAWHHGEVRRLVAQHGGREVDAVGDGFLAAFDLPSAAVRCALAVRDRMAEHSLPVRAGLHTGEVVHADGAVTGLAVHIAARVSALAGAGEVLVSGTVRDLLAGSGVPTAERGSHALKGVPGRWEVLAVEG